MLSRSAVTGVAADVAAVVVAAGVLRSATACGAKPESPAARSADQHAQRASGVLSEVRDHAVPATWAATWVTGTGTDDTIAALVARGDTFAGTIVLRISVATGSGGFDAQQATQCYRYTLDRYTDAAKRMSSCPDLPALDLPAPPQPDLLTPASATRVAAALTRLPERSPATVRTAVTALFDPAVWLVVGPDPTDGSTYLIVHSGTSCLISHVPTAGPVRVTGPLQRAACTGG